MHIQVDWALCDGNGVCAVEAPTMFELDDDDNLVLLEEAPSEERRPEAEAAVRACPKRALAIR